MSSSENGAAPQTVRQSERDDSPEVERRARWERTVDEEHAGQDSPRLENNIFNLSWNAAWLTVFSSCLIAWITIYLIVAPSHWLRFVLLPPLLLVSLIAAMIGFGSVIAPGDSGLSTKDAWLIAAYSFFIICTTACVMIAVHHWAGYVFLAPIMFFSFWGCLYGISVAQSFAEEELQKTRLQSRRRGERPPLYHPNIRTRLIRALKISFLSLCFGLLGTYVTSRMFAETWPPDLSRIDAGPELALYIWFIIFAALGAIGPATMVIMAPILLAMTLYRKLRPIPRSLSDFDPTKAPEIPQIRCPAYPMVVDCLVPYYVAFSFAILAVIGGFYSSWYLLAVIGFCVALIPTLRNQSRLENEVFQLQVYIDWCNDSASDEEASESIVALLKEREEVKDRYANSALGFMVIGIFGLVPLLRMQDSTTISRISWGWLYFVAVFLLGNYIVYRQWRKELLQLYHNRELLFPLAIKFINY